MKNTILSSVHFSVLLLAFGVLSCTRAKRVEDDDVKKIVINVDAVHVYYLDSIYICYQNYYGDIIKLNLKSNMESWRYKSKFKRPSIANFTYGDTVYFNEWGGEISALDSNGKIIFTQVDPVTSYSNAIVGDGACLVTSGVHGILAMDQTNGSARWKINCSSASGTCDPFIEITEHELIVAGLGDRENNYLDNILSVDKDSGDIYWKKAINGRVITKLASDRSNLYFGILENSDPQGAGGRTSNKIICMDKDTGEIVWEKKYDFQHSTDFISYNGSLFLNGDRKILCVNVEDGNLLWTREEKIFLSTVAIYKNNLIVKIGNGIELASTKNGQTVFAIAEEVNAGPWVLNEKICYSSRGKFYLLKD
jgi:outer membrane protein assembly factor BamB